MGQYPNASVPQREEHPLSQVNCILSNNCMIDNDCECLFEYDFMNDLNDNILIYKSFDTDSICKIITLRLKIIYEKVEDNLITN